MWKNTLMVVSSDNGGPIYAFPGLNFGPFNIKNMHGGASNRPHRGGKASDWEGGIRVNAFVSGGFVPAGRRGSIVGDYIHVCDWYATFCHLAGVDSFDERAAAAGLPPTDGINQWPLLSGQVHSGNRTELHISEMTLIQGPYKLLTGGAELLENFNKKFPSWLKPFPVDYPPFDGYWDGYGVEAEVETVVSAWNAFGPGRSCKQGCLFDIQADPSEKVDLGKNALFAEVRDRMMARLKELNQGNYIPDRGDTDPAACEQVKANGGFFGPWVDMPHRSATNSLLV